MIFWWLYFLFKNKILLWNLEIKIFNYLNGIKIIKINLFEKTI